MSLDVPDIIVEFQSDEDELSDEAENFYTQCDRLYDRVAGYPVVKDSECKKDHRSWLYKNRNFPVIMNDELTYDQVFSVVGVNGRRFKKDSRVWLHKSTEKALKLKELDRMMKNRQKNSNCKFTPSYDDTGLDENSLTAMSNITICNDPRCQNMNTCSKRSHEMVNQECNMAGPGFRNRKRRKVNHSAPPSPAHFANFAVVSRSVDSEICFANRLNNSRDNLDLNSDDSNDSHVYSQRTWKNERSPKRWREFSVKSSATPVTSGGSINLADSSPKITSRDECLHVQYSPKRKVSVYDIVNEDYYDFFKSPDEGPWSNAMDVSEVQLNKR